ncbi:hypothetical protein GQ53DRAFT_784524 [Thozetella sp. PMI_491]|nr:hypothetical protein GQ53DRAFT_784524 [Thozetella sp. PMI_491]
MLRILILTLGALSFTAAECSRESLMATAELYIAAQASGKMDDFKKVWADGITYMENNKKGAVTGGVLNKALKLDHNRTTADSANCVTFTELVSTAGPYVLGTQLHTADGKVTSIDIIAATTGSWSFNAKTTLSHFGTEDWGVLEPSQRPTRQLLKDSIDAYLNMWSNSSAKGLIPWGTPCARTEGSMYVTPDCRAGAPDGGSMQIGNRRYVIDEVTGSAESFCSFGGMPDSHEMRIVDGKVKLVHTITV